VDDGVRLFADSFDALIETIGREAGTLAPAEERG
jgi:hypothetical protein